MNRTNKQRHMVMDNRLMVTTGQEGGVREAVDGVKWVKYVVTLKNFKKLKQKDEECLKYNVQYKRQGAE